VQQFSEDIQRYLDKRPVTARPDTLLYRVSRFTARNRWSVLAGFAVAASLFAGTAVSIHQANVARMRFDQVRKLAGRFIEMEKDVARLPGSTEVREKLVANALEYLDNLARSAGNDAELLHEVGDAYGKIGMAQGYPGQPNLGKADDAIASFRKAIEYEGRAASLNPSYLARKANLESRLAYLAMLNGRLPEARGNIEDAAAILERLRATKPADPELSYLAAGVELNRGDLADFEGDVRGTMTHFRRALPFASEYARVRPEPLARARVHLYAGLFAASLRDNERYDEALHVLRDYEPIIDELLKADPDNPAYIRQKMSSANYEGQVYDFETGKALGKPVEAVAAYTRYASLAQRLATADPRNASARLSLAVAYFQLSYPLAKIDRVEGLKAAEKSVGMFDSELARTPTDRVLLSRRARALRHLARALSLNGRGREARQAIEEGIEAQRQLLSDKPSDGAEQRQLELSEAVLASLQ
jgi:tetratricopeptide (TPR) repeat protein